MRQRCLDHLPGMVRLQPFGNTAHGPVPRRRGDESEQETGSPSGKGLLSVGAPLIFLNRNKIDRGSLQGIREFTAAAKRAGPPTGSYIGRKPGYVPGTPTEIPFSAALPKSTDPLQLVRRIPRNDSSCGIWFFLGCP